MNSNRKYRALVFCGMVALTAVGPGRAERGVPAAADLSRGNFSLGKADAPVLIVEFSDFQCFYCKKFTRETLPRLKQEYIDTGKVRFVFSDFPLDSHPQAMAASRAARCAGRQDRFWEFHDRLFAANLRSFGPVMFEGFARELKLDMGKFRTCLKDRAVRNEIMANLARGQRAGVTGTPAFLIFSRDSGVRMSGAYPFEAFQSVLEKQLKGK